MGEYFKGDTLICPVENLIESQVLDYGASFHASYSKDVMQNFKNNQRKVRMADNKCLHIMGVGDRVLKINLGTQQTLKNVFLIPYLKRMLISVGQLDNEGHRVTFDDHKWKVKRGDLIIAKGQKHGTLYMVDVSKDESKYC